MTGLSCAVVVCAYTDKRWDSTCAALQAAVTQSPPPDEVVLVVDYNPELEQRFREALTNPLIRVIANNHRQGLAGARNSGTGTARAQVVAFLDDDALPRTGWLSALLAPFADQGVAGVGGWVEADWQSGRPGWWPNTFDWVIGCSYQGLPGNGGTVRNPIGASMAIRTQLIVDAGGFAEEMGRLGANLAGCEETELCIRISASNPQVRFVHATTSAVDHWVPEPRATLNYFLRRCWGEGQSKAAISRLSSDHPATSSEDQPAQALGPEVRHVLSTIPRSALADLRQFRRGRDGPLRAQTALAGTATTSLSYLAARVRSDRSNPPSLELTSSSSALSNLAVESSIQRRNTP